MKITNWSYETVRVCEDLLRHSERLPDKNPADLERALCVFTVCQAAVLSAQSGGTARALQPTKGMKMPQHVTLDQLVGQHLRHGPARILPPPVSHSSPRPVCLSLMEGRQSCCSSLCLLLNHRFYIWDFFCRKTSIISKQSWPIWPTDDQYNANYVWFPPSCCLV